MSPNHRVLLVVNPISGGIDKSPIIDHVTKELENRGNSSSIFETSGKSDKLLLQKKLKEFKPDRIFSIGGDGTIKLIAELLTDASIPLGVFPAGSANGLAENLDLPDDVEEQTRIAMSDHFVLLDTISINEELCLHVSDVGLNAALIKNYEEGNIRGKWGYLVQAIPTLLKSNFPFEFEISKDGQRIHKKAVLLALANAKRYGTGSTINPKGAYDDGQFEILIFKNLNLTEILKTFMNSEELSEDFVEIIPASEVKITCRQSVPFQIDGEYRGEVTEVHAAISPLKVKIAVPEKKSKIGNR